MNLGKPNILVRSTLIVAIICVATVIFLPTLTRPRSKTVATKSISGPQTALRQIYVATLKYSQVNGRAPSKIDDLIGIMVPPAEGSFVPFSKETLSKELGVDVSSVYYFPESINMNSTFTNGPVILACSIHPSNERSNFVLYIDGSIGLLDSNRVWQQIDKLMQVK